MQKSDLGAFLKAQRGHTQPRDAGLTALPGRRVPGLRREEVAMLAGVSVDYYARLEQGRERSPSAAVLNAIAGALNLDEDLREHTFRLAGLAPTPLQQASDVVDPALGELLSSWTHTPAVVINRRLDVLAVNDLATALYSDFAKIDNLVRMTFIDPAGRGFFADWQRAAEACIANLRLALGHPNGHNAVPALVTELHEASADFRLLWARHDVRGKTTEAKSFRHREVGDLTLGYMAFDVRSAPGQQLVVYQAPANSPSSEKLRLLGTIVATTQLGKAHFTR